MGGGVTIVDFSLLMTKNMSTTISAFAAVLMEKFDGSLMFLALTTSGRALLIFRFKIQALKPYLVCTFYLWPVCFYPFWDF